MNKKILALLGAGHAITDLNQGALPILLTFLQPVLGLSQLQVGAVMMTMTLGSSFVQPLFGIFSDRFRAAWLVPLGCLLAGVGMGLVGLFPNYTLLLVLSTISGLGIAAFHPEGSKFARLASGSKKASGMSLFAAGGNIGFAAGPVLAGVLFSLAGLSGSVGFMVINGAMAALLWASISTITGTKNKPLANDPGEKEKIKGLSTGISRKTLAAVLLLVVVVIMRSWVHMGMVTFLPQYYVLARHQTQAYAAAITSVFLIAGAVGTFLGGPIADRWGLKNTIAGSMLLQIPLLYFFNHSPGGLWDPFIVGITGFAVISTFAVTVVLGQELLPNNVGLASGLMLGFAIGMGGLGAALLGWIGDHWGFTTIFNIMMLFPVVGLFFSLFLPRQVTRVKQAH